MERDLLSTLKAARERVKALDGDLAEAHKVEDLAVKALVDYLEAKGASATGRYDGVGWAKLSPPRLFASYPKEAEAEVFDWLKAQGQESAIKLTVHPSTFSQVVGECLREGRVLADSISYYLKPQIRVYGNGDV